MVIWSKLAASIAFYTCLPMPTSWALDFQKVACFAPLVGIGIGGLLGLLDLSLDWAGLPILTRSALIVAVWIAITGGLHLDGAMDTADGLAVTEPKRRLDVMADSVTGAFGAMTAVTIILLKTAALSDLNHIRWLSFVLAAGWGRWSQQVAIACYPYLKPTGKGAFHKAAIRSLWDTLPSLLILLGLSISPLLLSSSTFQPTRIIVLFVLLASFGGFALALLLPAWLNRKLGGHTGDTYGAVVEWTETLFVVMLTIV